jgi:chloramphenicol 3-O-phosphotransferase
MPEIAITALISDGASVLVLQPPAAPAGVGLALPRCTLGEAIEIEEALAEYLRATLGIEIVEQSFVDTLYERDPDGSVRLNNLQHVTEWAGAPAARAGGQVPVWMPASALVDLELPGDLRAATLATLGIAAPPEPERLPSVPAGRVIVITGAAGAGKSSVARGIAERLGRGALVSLDQLWHMVVSGAPLPSWRGGDEAETRRFIRLTLRNAAALARNVTAAGFNCVIEGVVESTEELDALLEALGPIETYFVTLVPQLDVLLQRDQGRNPEQRMGERSAELHAIFQFNGEWRGMRVDSTGLSPEQTADLILESLDDARVN